ncbi:hypothetical protein CERZMDRAFT_115688 [Cercospora zeae-maydis SCOH1-5]|uniref:Peptidase M20 dimerisation domain-containing protein n=1 Tax=Cercospora zeae-maydis SCOH1-5 TaxID=717836 RepID=A0A6A6EWI0_9PEZI|nr:hypothetical protein CERZMDRAFT_115688 [Cercospora zeae-maydis SCOH1-5]
MALFRAATRPLVHTPRSRVPSNSYCTPRWLNLNHNLFAFHKNLVEIESISGNEKHIGDWLSGSLKSQGYNVEKQYLPGQSERFNVLAWPGDQRDAKVMLTSHIDTVPPFIPYKRSRDGTISGRGAVDAKGSVAAQVLAVNDLLASSQISPSDVSLLFVAGEEVGGVGMQLANDLKLSPRAVIFGEPTVGKLVSGHKGIMVVQIHAKGRAAHSGYPWLGRSANNILLEAVTSIRNLETSLPQSEKYGKTTFNLGLMSGGTALGVVPESANAGIAVRIATGSPADIEAAITASVRSAMTPYMQEDTQLSDLVDLDFSASGYGPIDLDADVPGFDVTTVNYGSDIPWLKKTSEDQRRYLYGPGSIFVAHTDHEGLSERDLIEGQRGYERIILHALQTKSHTFLAPPYATRAFPHVNGFP